jgi:hypothetical protein
MSILIGIYSSTPQSGKSTVADYLCARHGFMKAPFASVMKVMAAPILEAFDIDTELLFRGDKSALVYQDKTIRHLLQTLGTEWGRKHMGENFWVDVWARRAKKMLELGNVVVDDMRFINELNMVEALGGWTWKVTRPGASSPTNGHASEGALDGCIFDTELVNAGTIADLEETVEMAMRAGGR